MSAAFQELEQVVGEKIRHGRAHAEPLLIALTERRPDFAPALYELALLYGETHRGAAALRAARAAFAADPADERNGALLVHRLHAVGATAEAQTLASELVPRTAQTAERLAVLNSFGDYLAEVPLARAHDLLSQARDQYGWIDAEEVAARIGRAIDERSPFALIRLGDGEGAFARVDGADEARFAPLYRWMRDDWVRFQFGPNFDAYGSGYEALTRLLMPSVMHADVLGVTYPNWIEHEYGIGSPRGVPCTVNIHRHLVGADPENRPVLCDQIVHLHLHDRQLLEPLIRRAGRLTAISCLPDLPRALKRRFELEEADMIAVPREETAPHLREGTAVEGAHFPDVFWDVIRRLSNPPGGSWEGRLFVIAAGTLGKFYAVTIKRHGGIALDLGSLVDAWLRLPSRFGYHDQYALES